MLSRAPENFYSTIIFMDYRKISVIEIARKNKVKCNDIEYVNINEILSQK